MNERLLIVSLVGVTLMFAASALTVLLFIGEGNKDVAVMFVGAALASGAVLKNRLEKTIVKVDRKRQEAERKAEREAKRADYWQEQTQTLKRQ